MRFKYTFLIALTWGLMVSCNGKSVVESNLRNADFKDSVSWYLGQSAAMYYWQGAASDSILAGNIGREAYEKGFRKGLEILSSDEAYNEGLRAAINMAKTFTYLSNDYTLDINKSMFLSGLSIGMKSDSALNRMEIQQQLTLFFNCMQRQREEKLRADADKLISGIASNHGFKKISNALYYKIDVGSKDSVCLMTGDIVSGSISVTTLDGKEIIAAQDPSDIRVGYFPSKLVNEALEIMYPNSVYSFISTASGLFGNSVPRDAGISADTPIVWSLRLGNKSTVKSVTPRQ